MILPTLTSLCVLLAPALPQEDLAALAGTWRMNSLKINGKAVPTDVANKLRIIVKDDIMTMRGSVASNGQQYMPIATVFHCKMTLGTSKGLKTIDVVPTGPGNSMHGIYKLEGGKLTLCWGTKENRPTSFVSKPDSGVNLSVYQKE